jgi:uncharacterized protein involved in response to NO
VVVNRRPENAPSPAARVRREPYRVLFPLGVLLAWAGVFHWLLLALGLTDTYRAIFHSMAQIQGFMTCFALGFLFTFIPRRTQTDPPAPWELGVAVVAPVGTVVSAWFERWALSQVFWLALMVTVLAFAVRRVRAARPGPGIPPSFVWVPCSFLLGFISSVVTGFAAAAGDESMWIHDLGRGLLLQGVFSGLAVGVGGVLLPVLTRGEPFPEGSPARRLLGAHLLAFVLFVTSFWIEHTVSLRLGFLLRAAVAGIALLGGAKLWRPPAVPGLHRRLAWLAAWMIPLGYASVAIFPGYLKAGLHIVFIGGFALMAFAVSVHVVLSHGGRPELLSGAPWQVVAIGGLVGVAVLCRILVNVDPGHLKPWIGVASSAFLLCTVAWASLCWPRIRQR